MRKLLIVALLGCAAVPAQAAVQIYAISFDANITGTRSIGGPFNPQIFPISFGNGTHEISGSWEYGFNPLYVPNCSQSSGCLKPTISGNTLSFGASGGTGALPCYCAETITLNFDQAITSDFSLLSPEHFLGGTYSFSEGTYAGSTNLSGVITSISIAKAVPEPATWAMMVAGFGLAGVALRRRSARVLFA